MNSDRSYDWRNTRLFSSENVLTHCLLFVCLRYLWLFVKHSYRSNVIKDTNYNYDTFSMQRKEKSEGKKTQKTVHDRC